LAGRRLVLLVVRRAALLRSNAKSSATRESCLARVALSDDWEPEELGPLPYVPTVMDADLFPDNVAAWAAFITPGSAVATPMVALDPRRLSPPRTNRPVGGTG
jgi:hypothetical protein